jgi:hypothetical protein
MEYVHCKSSAASSGTAARVLDAAGCCCCCCCCAVPCGLSVSSCSGKQGSAWHWHGTPCALTTHTHTHTHTHADTRTENGSWGCGSHCCSVSMSLPTPSLSPGRQRALAISSRLHVIKQGRVAVEARDCRSQIWDQDNMPWAICDTEMCISISLHKGTQGTESQTGCHWTLLALCYTLPRIPTDRW